MKRDRVHHRACLGCACQGIIFLSYQFIDFNNDFDKFVWVALMRRSFLQIAPTSVRKSFHEPSLSRQVELAVTYRIFVSFTANQSRAFDFLRSVVF
jgi:hypothetical protein